MVQDARQRTKVYLDTYLTPGNLTKDNGAIATFITVFGNPDYPIMQVFKGTKNVDLIFSIDMPNSTPLIGYDQTSYGYKEHVPIKIFCIDKNGITGTKLKWKAEAELRRITETYPLGSLRSLERIGDNDKNFGSTIIYSAEYVLTYVRDTT